MGKAAMDASYVRGIAIIKESVLQVNLEMQEFLRVSSPLFLR